MGHYATRSETQREREGERGRDERCREDDRHRPRLGCHERYNASRCDHLGSEASIVSINTPSIFSQTASTPPWFSEEVGRSPPNLAILSPFSCKSLSICCFLLYLERRSNLSRRPSHQCNHFRCNCCLRHGPRRRDAYWVCSVCLLYIGELHQLAAEVMAHWVVLIGPYHLHALGLNRWNLAVKGALFQSIFTRPPLVAQLSAFHKLE